MKKTIKRNEAMGVFSALGAMALGHLNEDVLEAVMSNFNECRKVEEEMKELNEELSNRLYADVDKERKEKFFAELGKVEALRNKTFATKEEMQKIVKDIDDIITMLKTNYSDVYELYRKHDSVYRKLLAKEIEVDFHEVDADEFIKGIVKGKKDAPIHEIRAAFAPMFKEEDKVETDFSELDELLSE